AHENSRIDRTDRRERRRPDERVLFRLLGRRQGSAGALARRAGEHSLAGAGSKNRSPIHAGSRCAGGAVATDFDFANAGPVLRTPVSVILSQTQTALSRQRGAGEYREALEACQRAAQRMRKLTESLLELARLDAGQEPIKRERFDLARVARECVELVRPLATE